MCLRTIFCWCCAVSACPILIAAGNVAASSSSDDADVAIVAAAAITDDTQSEPAFTDPQAKLLETGLFRTVDLINVAAGGDTIGTPSLEQLLQYDAVLTFSNVNYDDSVALGDVLAEYVDAGGGVVVAVFANTSMNINRQLRGSWQDGGYIAIPQGGDVVQGSGQLGEILIDDHPIFEGVETFATEWTLDKDGFPAGGFRPLTLDITPGSTKVATWDTGHTLAAVAPNENVVEIGFYPVSSTVNAELFWDDATDGALIMANALRFAGKVTCDEDIAGDDGEVGTEDLLLILAAWGECEGQCPPSCIADISGDCEVNTEDLLAVLAAWGECD